MTRLALMTASALLAAAASGCTAEIEGGQPGTEAPGAQTEAVLLNAPIFDPATCTQQPTQCNGMHCCPPGYAMTGAHFGDNTFQCRPVLGADESTCYVDSTTSRTLQDVSLKACPPGYYMKGHHEGHNASTCCAYPYTNRSLRFFLDGDYGPPTQASDRFLQSPWPFAGTCQPGTMHVCPDSWVMEGVHIGNNYFLCGT